VKWLLLMACAVLLGCEDKVETPEDRYHREVTEAIDAYRRGDLVALLQQSERLKETNKPRSIVFEPEVENDVTTVILFRPVIVDGMKASRTR
jgi:hypothetical protein